ncbi:GNAT family N-acetyltransferase [Arsukibacterium tuosuense]|nr:GNAT family N-acetyltransferase [Arsukibacterium tuosuense]
MSIAMKIEVLDHPEQALIDLLDLKIAEFNWANWEVKERLPIAVQIKDDNGEVIAGSAGRTFGNWLQINTLWVSETLRGQDIGSKILQAIELAAKQRGCVNCLLDTLNFQAMPFYKKHGYHVQWVQENYPKTGCKYFMVKRL